uniref:5'-3' exonuclease, C-terminal domain-containing protein n=1 Tax=Tanacetum cinerariifolium TaxID=118510 RepID=A0A699IIG0_TANCI|nr:5'-3' exonuclease, C-terminal domain-containing protein [Tanacetum cinerariifolium]
MRNLVSFKALQQENISYVVTPYKAHAQMIFSIVGKHVYVVITKDSDLIPFGCPTIVYKMDKYGQRVEFQYSKVQNNRELNLLGFTRQMIIGKCILSSCEYLQSFPGMGLKKALIRFFTCGSMQRFYDHVLGNSLNGSANLRQEAYARLSDKEGIEKKIHNLLYLKPR